MNYKEILEITAAIATIIAGIIALGGVILAWKKKFFHNLHALVKHHSAKIKNEQSKEEIP